MILKAKKNTSKGFTLIELLVVIAIISLLSTVVLASTQAVRAKANATYKLQTAKQYVNAFELYRLDNNYYPTFSGLTLNAGYCLGSKNPNSDCYNSQASQNANLNTAISNYIPGLPSDTKSLLVVGTDVRGIVYKCISITNGSCQSYQIRWWIEGNTPYCGDGSNSTPGSGFLECIITK